jgi:hypothetical protein
MNLLTDANQRIMAEFNYLQILIERAVDEYVEWLCQGKPESGIVGKHVLLFSS